MLNIHAIYSYHLHNLIMVYTGITYISWLWSCIDALHDLITLGVLEEQQSLKMGCNKDTIVRTKTMFQKNVDQGRPISLLGVCSMRPASQCFNRFLSILLYSYLHIRFDCPFEGIKE